MREGRDRSISVLGDLEWEIVREAGRIFSGYAAINKIWISLRAVISVFCVRLRRCSYVSLRFAIVKI